MESYRDAADAAGIAGAVGTAGIEDRGQWSRAGRVQRSTAWLSGASLALALVAGGCSWVDVDREAEAVGVARTLEEVAHCRKVGEIGSKTMADVGIFSRNDTKVAVELERLSRNDAVGMGANTIVPLGPVTAEGTRRYAAFRCPVDAG